MTMMMMIIVSTTIFRNITKKLETMTYFVFTISGCFIAVQGVICYPPVRKGVIKLQT